VGSSAGSAAPAVVKPKIKQGVAPLRAGEGHSFLLRRLHSLTGIVPVGLFLIEHFISNAFAVNGPAAYTKQVEFLTSFPFVVALELFGIWLPILFHSLYGFYIWYRGDSNIGEYPWTGNWMYTLQRWTGGILLLYGLAYLAYSLHRRTYFEPSRISFRKSAVGISEYLGGDVLPGWHHRRLVALCLWSVAVRREVGDRHRRPRPAQVWICVRHHRGGIHCGGDGNDAVILPLAIAPSEWWVKLIRPS